MLQKIMTFRTQGRGALVITQPIEKMVNQSAIDTGLCYLFIRHTSASLIICENADAQVLRDLERFFARLIPDGDPLFKHTLEGPDGIPNVHEEAGF